MTRPAATRAKVLAAMREGNFLVAAARAARVDPDTIYNWAEKDPEFAAELRKAEAEGELKLVARATAANPMEVLSRRHRDRWGKEPTKLEATVAMGHTLGGEKEQQKAALQSLLAALESADDKGGA